MGAGGAKRAGALVGAPVADEEADEVDLGEDAEGDEGEGEEVGEGVRHESAPIV